MRFARRILAASLSVLLSLEALGPSAWAQVVPHIAPASAGAAVGAAGAGLQNLGASATAPTLLSPALPMMGGLSPLSAPVASAPSAHIAPTALPAAAVPVPVRAGVSGHVVTLAESGAPALEKASSSDSSRADLKDSGAELEILLSGEILRKRPAAHDGHHSHAPFQTTSALLPREDHREPILQDPAAATPLPEIPPQARSGFRLYAAGISTVKVGIEALNLVVPTLLLAQYGAATLVGALFLSSQLAGLVAGWIAGPLADRFGPTKVLAVTAVLQIAAIGTIPLAFAFGTTLGLPVIFTLFTVNGMLGGAFDIARRAALPQILGRDERVLNAHNAKIYLARELAAMAGIFGTGYLLGKIGYLATLGLHPAAYIVAALLFSRLAFRRGSAAPAPETNPSAPADGPKGALAALKGLTRGARLVWSDPAMRRAALLNIPVITLHNLFHQMLAVVYAAKVLGSPASAAILLGAWNLGEFAAALILRRQSARQGEKASLGPAWLRYAAAAVLGSWLLWLFPTVYVAAPVIFLMAMGMLGNELGLTSYFQSAAKKEDVGAVTGFVYSLATSVAMVALLTMGWVFDGFGGAAGFLTLAVALSAVAAFFWTSSHRSA